MRTHISYWVKTTENSFMQMSPYDITKLLEAGYQLTIRIHQEYSSAFRTNLIYG